MKNVLICVAMLCCSFYTLSALLKLRRRSALPYERTTSICTHQPQARPAACESADRIRQPQDSASLAEHALPAYDDLALTHDYPTHGAALTDSYLGRHV